MFYFIYPAFQPVSVSPPEQLLPNRQLVVTVHIIQVHLHINMNIAHISASKWNYALCVILYDV